MVEDLDLALSLARTMNVVSLHTLARDIEERPFFNAVITSARYRDKLSYGVVLKVHVTSPLYVVSFFIVAPGTFR